jgi:RNA recognition motif-containing protein
MKIYVGNISGEVTDDMIRGAFSRFGDVGKVEIMRDRNGISKGFGFVEIADSGAAASAVAGLNRAVFHDRTLDVSPQPERGGGPRKGKARLSHSRR